MPLGHEVALPKQCAVREGFNLHAAVRIPPRDREGLERLCRYVNRPALAKGRLERRPDGAVLLRLKRAWSDGTTAFVFTPEEFVGRLAALVPPPHSNLVLYRGVLAARSRFRARVVALAQSPARESVSEEEPRLCRPDRRSKLARRRWLPWSWLLHRVFDVEGWACPSCGQRMVLRSVTVYPPATTKILRGLSSRAPPAEVSHGV